jgi:pyruvate dehydrogenase E2 component (dihydrolipoamide acetyltransferase)
MGDFVMPSLGADMDAGTLVEWKIQPGDHVHRGDIVATVETQKGAIEIEIFEDGIVDALVVPPGSKVPVGAVLAHLKTEEKPTVQAPAAGPSPMRQAIAHAMSRSHREIPAYFLSTRVDVSETLSWLSRYNAHQAPEDRLLPVMLFLKAVALAVKEFPEFNGTFENDAFRPGSGIHLGVATHLRQGGLIVPALHEVEKMPLPALGRAFSDLLSRARSGQLRSSELSDATLTVTALGDRGVESVYGVIFPPQVALVGFGKVTDEAWAVDGTLVVRPVVHVSLVGDHRVSDGHRGGLFLSRLSEWLSEPEAL